jgi:hypothetical protein
MNFPDIVDFADYRGVYPQIANARRGDRSVPRKLELEFLEKAGATELPPRQRGAGQPLFCGGSGQRAYRGQSFY